MNLEPSKQINLYSHSNQIHNLINLYQKNMLPNKILLSGEKGIGKCTLAYHFINYILSSNEDYSYDLKELKINPENKFFKLTLNKSNPNLFLIDVTEDKKNIEVNQIRNLIYKLNKSSFNSKPRFVLIDNIELLNINSVNALLKTLEEPNDNINFLLINNNKKNLPTLKSRCLNFKIFLTTKQSIEVTQKITNTNLNLLLNEEFMTNYSTPGEILSIINYADKNNLNIKELNLKKFISQVFLNKQYKKDVSNKYLIYLLIEIYFSKNISLKNLKLLNLHNYFLKKINDTKTFNLDDETLFMEFEERVLNG